MYIDTYTRIDTFRYKCNFFIYFLQMKTLTMSRIQHFTWKNIGEKVKLCVKRRECVFEFHPEFLEKR